MSPAPVRPGWRRRGLLLALLLGTAQVAAAAPPSLLRIGNGNEPETLDPQRVEGVSASNIVRDLYEGLSALSPRGEVVPGAAERWEISADGREYLFHLRPQARWSNGDALSAEDFVAGLRRSVDPATASAYAQMLAPIEGATAVIAGELPGSQLAVQALDPQTLRIRLRAPTPYFLGLLAHPSSFPVHRPSLARWGRDFPRPGRLVSNGAYALVDWVPQGQVRLRRNPHYWNDGNTGIDELEFRPSEDANGELKRYRADELDISYEIPLLQAPWLRRHLGGELRIAPYIGTYFYGFNCSQPPFKDNPKLRAALTLAVDRAVIVNKVMNGVALPAYSLVPPGISGYTPQQPEWAGWTRERRLAEARRLYAEAGYSAAHPLEVELRYNTHDDHRRIATVIAAMWKQWLGVRTRLLNEEFKVFIQNRNLRQLTQLFRAVWIGDYDDASAFTDILHSRHGQNDMAYDNPRYDALLAAAAAEADPARRQGLLAEAERLLQADWPVLPIYTYASKHLVKPWVQGWQDNALDIHYSKDLRIVGRPAERSR
ncbi:MAG: peptide ABC transporter substrate-binding protein [Stagnimonas sp.]|nr:peptide ABC transporter substrate-binding protein [Stagnimonas sp.]